MWKEYGAKHRVQHHLTRNMKTIRLNDELELDIKGAAQNMISSSMFCEEGEVSS